MRVAVLLVPLLLAATLASADKPAANMAKGMSEAVKQTKDSAKAVVKAVKDSVKAVAKAAKDSSKTAAPAAKDTVKAAPKAATKIVKDSVKPAPTPAPKAAEPTKPATPAKPAVAPATPATPAKPAVVPAAPAPKPAPAAAPADAGCSVSKMAFAMRIDEAREPVGEAAEFPASVRQIYCWTKLDCGGGPVAVKHVWYKDGVKMDAISISAKSGRARIASRKTIAPGAWKVEVVKDSAQVIGSGEVTVK